MFKPGSIFIAFCMAAIAISLAVVLSVGVGLSLPIGLTGGLAAVLVVWLINRVMSAGASRPAAQRFYELEERMAALSERVMSLEPRLMRIDQAAQETARRAVAPLEQEIGELGTLMRALAEQVEAHEIALNDLPARQMARSPQGYQPLMPAAMPAAMPAPGVHTAASAPHAPQQRPVLDPVRATSIREALENDGIELHLQPVAALPQRRVIHYAVVPFLRDRDGVLMPPAEVSAQARLADLQPALDAFVLDRSLRIARRLKARERDISLFVQLAGETLGAANFTSDVAKRLDANADLASHLVIGFSQDALYRFGAIEAEMLASVGEKQFRFALSGVTDLDLDAAALHMLGVRFLRVPAEVLVDPAHARSAAIHPADLPGLLRRHAILLIAEGVDSESRVADLLDLDVRAAQGAVFGQPRPVRPEIFTGTDLPEQGSAAAMRPSLGAQQPFRSVARRA